MRTVIKMTDRLPENVQAAVCKITGTMMVFGIIFAGWGLASLVAQMVGCG